jgi:hypothetical protein
MGVCVCMCVCASLPAQRERVSRIGCAGLLVCFCLEHADKACVCMCLPVCVVKTERPGYWVTKLCHEHAGAHFVHACVCACVPVCAVKIGRPGYRVTKQFDAQALQRSLLFQVIRPGISCSIWYCNLLAVS